MSHRLASPSRIETDRVRNVLQHVIRGGGPGKRRPGVSLALGVGLTVLIACNTVLAAAATRPPVAAIHAVDFEHQAASRDARRVALWVSESRNNHGLPYAIVDKVDARVFVFDGRGHFQGSAAALLGMARGDSSVVGIGDREMSAIRAEDRTTPSGRFKASLDHDSHGQEILVIDYEASISLHAVVKGTPVERRAQRLASATSEDNRISYGCINVPLQFYKKIVSPAFAHTFGIVYILPEMSPASEFFGFQDVAIDPSAASSR
jgi:hypothetical protein